MEYFQRMGNGDEIASFKKYPRITVITTNFNSRKYIDLSTMSLRSIFELDYPNMEVIMVDSASNDGSYEILCEKGKEFERIYGKRFKCYKLRKDLGNSFALLYGYHKRDPSSKYILTVDNDFVIVNKKILKELVLIVEKYKNIGAIAPLPLWCERQFFKSLLNGNFAKRVMMNKCHLQDGVNLFDFLGNILVLFIFLPKSINPIINNELLYSEIILPASYVCSCFALYRVCDFFFPYFFYILGDDIAYSFLLWIKGFKVVYYWKLAGFHFSESIMGKVKLDRIYFKYRNSLLIRYVFLPRLFWLYFVLKSMYTFFEMLREYNFKGIICYAEYVRAFIHIFIYKYKERFIRMYNLDDKVNLFSFFKYYCVPSLIKRGSFLRYIFGCRLSGRMGLEYFLRRYIIPAMKEKKVKRNQNWEMGQERI